MGLPHVFDAALALVFLLPIAPLLMVLAWRWWWCTPVRGEGGRLFQRWSVVLPAHRRWRWLHTLGLRHAPVLLNIVRGDMAWVGPRPRFIDEEASPAEVLRPGLINPWALRSRSTTRFASEDEADRDYAQHRNPWRDGVWLMRGAAAVLRLPSAVARLARRVEIGDVTYDNLSMDEALATLNAMLDGVSTRHVGFVNAACVNIAARHRGYRRAMARATLVLPDGVGIRLASWLLGRTMRQNVNGTDLFPQLCDLLHRRRARLFLLGGAPGVAAEVARVVAKRWPGISVVGCRDGFFGVKDEGAVVQAVRASRADVLMVARGVPSQDLFIDRYLPQLGVNIAMGVGGLFDFVSGRIPRAPKWMRDFGLEWVWRLMQEPQRLWRRYLVGNFSFLGRVLLQAVGLRKRAPDLAPQSLEPDASSDAAAGDIRAVIFATPRVQSDLPLPADHLTALLPLGAQTLIERLMQRLAQTRVRDVDLVVCDRPDALRAVLGDGSRWGLRLNWHLVKDPQHPYGALDLRTSRKASRLLIGHADRCPSADSLRQLTEENQWRIEVDGGRIAAWSGWASVCPTWLPPRCASMDTAALDDLSARGRWPMRLHVPEDGTAVDTAEGLVQAQARAMDAPGSWIQRPWGAMSPLAKVDEQAILVGPVCIGPGCLVEAGARLGPHVVLSQDVVVGPGSQVSHCVVLPGSYVGADLTLADAVVNGPRVRHLRLGVEARMAESDGLLMHLEPRQPAQCTWLGRGVAALALLGVGPLLAAHVAWRRLQGRSPDWQPLRAVQGPVEGLPGLAEVVLRGGADGGDTLSRTWAGLAGVLDVFQGRRAWTGVRARTESEWYALRPEWQALLAHRPIGLLTAPAWYDHLALRSEACAAADVFAVVLPGARRAALILTGSRWFATVR